MNHFFKWMEMVVSLFLSIKKWLAFGYQVKANIETHNKNWNKRKRRRNGTSLPKWNLDGRCLFLSGVIFQIESLAFLKWFIYFAFLYLDTNNFSCWCSQLQGANFKSLIKHQKAGECMIVMVHFNIYPLLLSEKWKTSDLDLLLGCPRNLVKG